jgi:hypothetical protein
MTIFHRFGLKDCKAVVTGGVGKLGFEFWLYACPVGVLRSWGGSLGKKTLEAEIVKEVHSLT